METVGSDVEFRDSARWMAGGAAPPAGQGQDHRGSRSLAALPPGGELQADGETH